MSSATFYPNDSGISSMSAAYKTLVPLFGMAAGIIFLLTLLSSGIASSVTGTLSGQAITKGYLEKKSISGLGDSLFDL